MACVGLRQGRLRAGDKPLRPLHYAGAQAMSIQEAQRVCVLTSDTPCSLRTSMPSLDTRERTASATTKASASSFASVHNTAASLWSDSCSDNLHCLCDTPSLMT